MACCSAACLLVLPEMYGVGYPVLGKAVAGGYAIAFLLALLVGKMLACSLTIGIGGSGGVFAPSLFCGAMTGAAVRRRRARGRARRPAGRSAPTPWSGWVPCSPAPPGHRSPPS